MEKWLENSKVFIVIALIVFIILIAVYYYGRSSKPQSVVTVTNDEGGTSAASAADQQTATNLATQLYNNLDGGWGILGSAFADMGVFQDLSLQSNVVFDLTFASYNNQYNRSLLNDLRDSLIYFNTGVLDAVIARAEKNGITV